MSATGLVGQITKEGVLYHVKKSLKRFPKLRYGITMKYGDLYYQDAPEDEALEKAIYYEEDPEKTLKN